jgi:hypothetical protein
MAIDAESQLRWGGYRSGAALVQPLMSLRRNTRAARELTTLFEHQWASGRVPHNVFNPDRPPAATSPARTTGQPR